MVTRGFDSPSIFSSKSSKMKYSVRQKRTYTTWLTIEADSLEEAEQSYLTMVDDGSAYDQELEQMDVDNESYEIYGELTESRYKLPEEFLPASEVVITGMESKAYNLDGNPYGLKTLKLYGFDGNLMYSTNSLFPCQVMADDDREWVSDIGEYLLKTSVLSDINKGLGL
jgi:hypothetical protein